ncbi:MAG: hypothetical protein KAH20_14005 [Methylococcales bacterium]|nr:hypothetical protein [Methylococcales bacterium]
MSTTLTGTAKYPDSLLIKVLALEKKGILRGVVVMESFSVQIKIIDPRRVINELISMSHK